MKRLFILTVVLCLVLCSCAPITADTGNTGSSVKVQGGTDSVVTATEEGAGLLVTDKENTEAEYMGQDCFLAYVEGIGAQIEAQCLENQCIFGAVVINISPSTLFKDKDGQEISGSQIKVGDRIRVDFNGVVTRSLPPQVVATQISLY